MEVGSRVQFEWLKLLIAFIFILNAIDGLLTVLWVFSGHATEANPLMDHLLSVNPALFMTVKLTLVAMGSWLLWRVRRKPAAVVALFAVFLVYYALLVYHAGALAEHFFPDEVAHLNQSDFFLAFSQRLV